MDTQHVNTPRFYETTILVISVIALLCTVVALIAMGTNILDIFGEYNHQVYRWCMDIWVYATGPAGLLALITGIIMNKKAKAAGNEKGSGIAKANITLGVLDLVLGILPWIAFIFFWRWLSP